MHTLTDGRADKRLTARSLLPEDVPVAVEFRDGGPL
jgi:hypothetical protein